MVNVYENAERMNFSSTFIAAEKHESESAEKSKPNTRKNFGRISVFYIRSKVDIE